MQMFVSHNPKAGAGFHQEKCEKLSHCHIAGFMGNAGIYGLGVYEICVGNRGCSAV